MVGNVSNTIHETEQPTIDDLRETENVVELFENLVDGDRVALLANAYNNSGGVSIEVKHQAKQLHDAGYDVEIIAFEGDMEPPKGVNIYTIGQFDNLYLEKLNLVTFPIQYPTLRKVSRRLGKHDLVICHRYPLSAAAYMAKRNHDVPYVHWHYHIPLPSEMPTLPRKAWVSLLGYFEERSFLVRNANIVCSISESSREILLDAGGIDSIVLANDAEVDRFDDVDSDAEYLYETYDIDESDTVSVFVGRVTATKNVGDLVEMFNAVSDSVDGSKLVVVGKPTSEQYLKDLQEQASKDVVFTGFVTDNELAGIYETADLFVTASPKEGRNLPPLEAQEYGVPVLGFDVPGIRDVVSDGWLANSSEEYVDLWVDALSDETE